MSTGIPRYDLNDGSSLPRVGFGTHPLRGEEAVTAITSALEVGYRLLDTAVNYGNEAEVGEAVRRSGLPREEVQVSTKIPGRSHQYDLAVRSVEDSLRAVGTEYLDLVLIHWPNPSVDRYGEAWRALVEVRERGLVRSIGVSNFGESHLERIIAETGVTPAVNQIELHPHLPQAGMRDVDARLGIVTQAWSPLGKGTVSFDEPAIAGPAQEHGVTPAQVILRWQLQLGTLPLPKSAHRERQVGNLDVFGFTLADDEVARIAALERPDGRRFGGDPDTHEEM